MKDMLTIMAIMAMLIGTIAVGAIAIIDYQTLQLIKNYSK